MRVWVSGRGRVVAMGVAALALVLLVLPAFLRSLMHPVGVNREVLFKGVWGGDDNQFGRYLGADGKVHGPQSLARGPSGWIYILDTYNRRVLVLDAAGKPLRTFSLSKGNVEGYNLPPFPDDIAVDDLGRVYLADNRNVAILVFEPAGKPLAVLRVVPPEDTKGGSNWYGRLENLHAAADGVYADELWMDQEKAIRMLRKYSASGGPVPQVVQVTFTSTPQGASVEGPATGFMSSVVAGGRCYLDGPLSADPGKRSVTVTDDQGHRMRVVTVTGPASLAGATLLGVARDGRLYFGINLNQDLGQVAIVEAGGRVERVLSVDGSGFAAVHPARLSETGDIYVLSHTPEGVQLVRFAARKALRLGKRPADEEGQEQETRP